MLEAWQNETLSRDCNTSQVVCNIRTISETKAKADHEVLSFRARSIVDFLALIENEDFVKLLVWSFSSAIDVKSSRMVGLDTIPRRYHFQLDKES
jgi:hypothetical protein